MRVLLADDENSARRRLKRLLADVSDVEVIGEAADGLEALAHIESLKPDLVFLDIRMPELDGFGVVRAIPLAIRMPLVVFATSYDEHALEAFEANAIAYLLKPVEVERLSAALERARRLLASESERNEDEQRVQSVASGEKRLQRIVGRKANRLILLDPSEVLWFYVDGGIVRAQTATENYWVNFQLNQLETGLDSETFFRARREVLVNLSKVRSIKPYDSSTFMLVMSDPSETELIVSERRARELRQRLPGL
jgi:two-component system, LytTR family, response regulator